MSALDNAKTIEIAGKVVSKLELDGNKIWERITYKNWIKFSTEADGETIYNNGLGYKDNYRVRSSGEEAEQNVATCTGYIPYSKSDKLYIYPAFTNQNTHNAINFYDASFACLGQVTDSGKYYGFCNSTFKTTVVNGVSVLDLSAVTVSGVENIAYVRVTNDKSGKVSGGADMIITKNEEIT